MQRTAISLTRRSAVLSRAPSARQPDFRTLWNTSIFHLKAYQRSFSTAARFEGTGKSVSSFQSMRGRRLRLAGVQDRQGERGIALPLADRRQDGQASVGEFHHRGIRGALVVADLDAVPPPDRHFVHRAAERVRPVSREAIDATPDQEVRPELLRQAEQLVDVALAVADMDAPFRLAEQQGGLAHVVQPPDALLALDGHPGRIDLPLQGGG